jgi:hypothetical protein
MKNDRNVVGITREDVDFTCTRTIQCGPEAQMPNIYRL